MAFKNNNSTNSDEETTSVTSMSSGEIGEVDKINKKQKQPNRRRRNRRSRRKQKDLSEDKNSKNNDISSKRKSKKRQPKKYKSKATSTKPHDAPMQKRDMYFALDCEMVGVGPDGLDSALARLSIINWDNELVLDTYVKVEETVTDYRTFVSGITAENIQSDSAMTLEEVRLAAINILTGKVLIGHGLENDLKVTGITHPWCDVRDTATYEPFMRRTATEGPLRPRKLRDLSLEFLGKKIQEIGKAHSPIEDSIASMDLYKYARAEWENQRIKQFNAANDATQAQEEPSEKRDERSSIAGRLEKVAIHPNSPHSPYYSPHVQQSHTQILSPVRASQAREFYPLQFDHVSIPSPIGGPYHRQGQDLCVNPDNRLTAARLAQQHARARAEIALQYQNMIQSSHINRPLDNFDY